MSLDSVKPAPVVFLDEAANRTLATATVEHVRHGAGVQQSLEHLGSASDLAFVFVVGAAGSGKTKLLESIYAELLALYADDMAADPDVIPVLRLNAPAPTDGTFRYRALGNRLFQAARIPSRGRPSTPRFVSMDPIASRARTYGKSVDEILADAVQACVDRGVRVVILDEAGHLATVSYSLRHRSQLDVMKGLAQDAGIRFVLAGPYDLLDFRDASAQLGRRSRLVHLAPYDISVERERVAFAGVARAMIELIGVELPVGFDWLTVLHEGSLGCIGILRDWLVDAENAFRGRQGASSFAECLTEFRWSRGQRAEIAAELRDGMLRLDYDQTGERSKPIKPWRPPQTKNGQTLKPGERQPRRRYTTHVAA